MAITPGFQESDRFTDSDGNSLTYGGDIDSLIGGSQSINVVEFHDIIGGQMAFGFVNGPAAVDPASADFDTFVLTATAGTQFRIEVRPDDPLLMQGAAAISLFDHDGAHQGIIFEGSGPGMYIQGGLRSAILTVAEDGPLYLSVMLTQSGIPPADPGSHAYSITYHVENWGTVGEVGVGGTAAEHETLTADVSGIGDTDGIDPGTVAFQWLRDSGGGFVAIEGATAETFVLTDADIGATITLRYSYTDLLGRAHSVTSAATAAVQNTNDAPAGAVMIGHRFAAHTDFRFGDRLVADISAIADADGLPAPESVTYQWLRDGVEIVGATDAFYNARAEDMGTDLTVRYAFVDGRGTAESVTAAAVEIAADDFADTLLTTGEFVVGGQVEGFVDTVDDADWFRLQLEQGHTYRILLEPVEGSRRSLDPLLGGILRPDGTLIPDTGNDDGGPGLSSQLDFTAVATGSFLIAAEGFRNSTGAYTLSATLLRDLVPGATDGADTLNGSGAAENFLGLRGNDRMRGFDGNDVMYGGGGGDTLFGGNGRDMLDGGAGNDWLTGGGGTGTLYGGDGDDALTGGRAQDLLYGGGGNDSLIGTGGHDSLYGDTGLDSLSGGNGADWLDGGAESDVLRGGAGNDVLDGNTGQDSLFGDEGNDILYGGMGADTLVGGPGQDSLFGGGGADVFILGLSAARDTIKDFELGIDRIDILQADELSDLTFRTVGIDVRVSMGDVSVLVWNTTVAELRDAGNFLF